jgi:hypothetical protein
MKKLVISLFFILAVFSIAFSATSEEPNQAPQVNAVVKLWKDIQEYVDTHEFTYWYTNDHHVEYIVKNIFSKYGIFKEDDFFIAVMGEPGTGRPIAVMVILEYGGEQYSKNFTIKNVKEDCDDTGNCA